MQGLRLGVWGLGVFGRTCVVRSMKQGGAYRGDTNNLRIAAQFKTDFVYPL